MELNFYVYTHTDPSSNEVRYVGKGRGNRARDVYQRNSHWKNWFNKLKPDSISAVLTGRRKANYGITFTYSES